MYLWHVTAMTLLGGLLSSASPCESHPRGVGLQPPGVHESHGMTGGGGGNNTLTTYHRKRLTGLESKRAY